MKPCNQSKDWCVSLFGETLPKYILYGNVNRKTFTCDIFTGKFETHGKKTAYIIKVRNMKRDRWETRRTNEGFADIFLAIENYCKNNQILGNKIEVCPHKKFWAEKSREAHEKYVARGVLRAEEESREIRACGPQNRLTMNYDAVESVGNGKTGVETDKVFTYEAENCHAYETLTNVQDTGLHFKRFEMGQTSSGTINGPYTRSGFEVKKDGMKIKQNKIRPEALKKPDYMKRSGQPAGIPMDDLNLERGMKNPEAFTYMVRNDRDATKKFIENPFNIAAVAAYAAE